jgi:hypothetical protein
VIRAAKTERLRRMLCDARRSVDNIVDPSACKAVDLLADVVDDVLDLLDEIGAEK